MEGLRPRVWSYAVFITLALVGGIAPSFAFAEEPSPEPSPSPTPEAVAEESAPIELTPEQLTAWEEALSLVEESRRGLTDELNAYAPETDEPTGHQGAGTDPGPVASAKGGPPGPAGEVKGGGGPDGEIRTEPGWAQARDAGTVPRYGEAKGVEDGAPPPSVAVMKPLGPTEPVTRVRPALGDPSLASSLKPQTDTITTAARVKPAEFFQPAVAKPEAPPSAAPAPPEGPGGTSPYPGTPPSQTDPTAREPQPPPENPVEREPLLTLLEEVPPSREVLPPSRDPVLPVLPPPARPPEEAQSPETVSGGQRGRGTGPFSATPYGITVSEATLPAIGIAAASAPEEPRRRANRPAEARPAGEAGEPSPPARDLSVLVRINNRFEAPSARRTLSARPGIPPAPEPARAAAPGFAVGRFIVPLGTAPVAREPVPIARWGVTTPRAGDEISGGRAVAEIVRTAETAPAAGDVPAPSAAKSWEAPKETPASSAEIPVTSSRSPARAAVPPKLMQRLLREFQRRVRARQAPTALTGAKAKVVAQWAATVPSHPASLRFSITGAALLAAAGVGIFLLRRRR